MKNLTHYFKSPKEDSIDNTIKAGAPDEIIQEKAPSKKRKLSLSKSKKKKNLSPEEKKLSSENARCTHEEQSKTEYSTKKLSGNRNKRKREEDSNALHKKIKTTKSSINLKKNDKDESGQEVNSETTTCKSSVEPIKNATTETKENVNIVDESSLSCDEPLAKTKNRKLKKNLFEDSDENEADSSPAAEKENNDSTHSIISRNSLFSYFNKVDKETAFQKERKSEKLQVKAIVHSSPSGTKVERQSTDKISFQSKTKAKRRKNKLELDDSDSIEIISSEEIVDENSSINVNVPVEAEENQKSLSSPNLPNKPMPSNLASIFITKKSGLQTKNVENVSSPKLIEEAPSVGETVNAHCGKETKPNKQTKALSRSKKSGKKKKDLQNQNTSIGDGDCEDKISSKTGPQQEGENNSSIVKNSVSNIDDSRNTSSNIRKDLKDKLNSPSIESPADKNNLPITESPKVVKSTKNPNHTNGKTPEKSNINNKVKNNIDSEKTPKNKGPTINGYFTPKNKCSNNANVASMEKSTKKSPWVMKVCLNSASKNVMVDSDEGDFVESQDSGKGESEPVTIWQEEFSKIEDSDIEVNDSNHSVVVIDDDENPTIEVDKREDDGKRRSLPRNAKKPTPNILEEKEEEVKDTKSQTPKQPVKMWPFFQKGGARQAKEAPVDEAKLKAKMLFLESGVPESIKRKVETVKSETALGNPAPFPTISHVLQADVPAIGGGSDPISCSLPRVRSTSPPPAVPAWTTMLPTGPPEESEIPVFERPGNVKAFLEKLKEEEPKTEVKVLYKKLKEYKNKAESDIWTEVYKPTNSADMVGNSENIKKLKTWLETLKNCRKREGSVSSGDEFVNDDSDGDDNSFNNMAVICGPCGCGKTSAVYAIARELDIKVLEINASCNRSGKRILAEFSESTQSHHVERSQSVNGLFNNQSSGKKKRKKLKNSDKSKSEKTSLILVEDADLLFADCDDGFVPALASLAASSKRPIILVTNQDHTPHLDRFNNSKLLQISFNRPRPNKLSLWLRLVGLVEGVMMPPDLALRLVTARKCDVRRCLLDLQLMVHSNNSEVKDSSSVCRLWWEWPSGYQLRYELPTLLEPEEEEVDATVEVDRSVARARLRRVADTTRRLAALDVLARGSDNGSEVCREECEDPCPVAWTSRWRDSTALTPPATSHRALGHEAMWLQQALGVGHEHRAGQTPQEARWLSILRQGEQLFTAGVATTVHTNHPAVTCDYLPALRQLGRAEQVRLANYTRRANRFFNYLQGLGIHASKSYRDFMCDAFS